MQSVIPLITLIYFGLVANFYYQSNGFVKFFDRYYCMWEILKVLPIAFLATASYVHGLGVDGKARKLHSLGIVLGGVGDWLIGAHAEGIVPGAIAFGIGHLCYMATFLPGNMAVDMKLLGGVAIWGFIVNHLCLMPLMQEHPVAVGIMMAYSLILTFCFLVAYTHYFRGTQEFKQGHEALFYRFLGFTLFYISDNVLIFNHTNFYIPMAETIILTTYYSAQYFLLRANVHSQLAIQYGHAKSS